MNRTPSLCLATPCYAGLAHALYARSLLALGPACAARGVSLEIDLGGGEALIGRARAAMMANFVAGEATHQARAAASQSAPMPAPARATRRNSVSRRQRRPTCRRNSRTAASACVIETTRALNGGR